MTKYILIIEDEKELVKVLEYNFKKAGYLTKSTPSGKEGLVFASKDPKPSLILLDLMLPELSGIEVCRQLKSNNLTKTIPIIMVTAKGEEVDRVVGFELGAEDYLVKPFSVRELILRVQALLKRINKAPSDFDSFSAGSIEIDSEAHRVLVSKKEISLTALEFKLLRTFLTRKGRVQTRDRLLDDVWGIQAAITTRTVDTHVKRLREKLGVAGGLIETIRGVGYRFKSESSGDHH